MDLAMGGTPSAGFGFGAGQQPPRSNGTSVHQLEQQAQALIRAGQLEPAQRIYQQLQRQGQASARTLANLAAIAMAQGEPEQAEPLLAACLRLNPDNPEAWCNLGALRYQQDRHPEATEAFRQALRLRPQFPKAWFNLARTLQAQADHPQAVAAYEQVLALQPQHVEALSGQAMALLALDQPHKAQPLLLQARALKPADPTIHNNLGLVLKQLGNPAAAIEHYQQALRFSPNHPEILSNLGVAQMECGAINDAVETFASGLRQHPHAALLHRHRALCVNARDQPELLLAAQEALQHVDDAGERLQLHLTIGKYKLDLQASDALEWFAQAYAHRQRTWQLPTLEQALAANQQVQGLAEPCQERPRLIFIVGLPRSGSTLVETILSQNRTLLALGELPLLPQAIQENPQACGVQAAYWSHLNEYLSSRSSDPEINATRPLATSDWVSDKYLYNFIYCDVIARSFPNSVILHVHRNPMDNILSAYTNHFPHGNEWSEDLQTCVHYYHFYRQVMAAHQQRHPGRIIDVNYDQLVREPHKAVPAMIAACQLDWDPSHLHPETSRRSIQTASAVQARAAIHPSSLGRWRQYQEALRPYAEQLEQLGYATGLNQQR